MSNSGRTSVRAKILLADDHAITAESLRALLCEKFNVVGIATDGRALISQAHKRKPKCDCGKYSHAAGNGLEAAEHIRQSLSRMRFVFLTMINNPNLALSGFDSKRDSLRGH